MSTPSYVDNGAVVGGGGGASLPPASAAGELLRSTGAGDDYEAVGQGDVFGDMLVAVIGGEPAGTAITSDGAGDATLTSAAVSTLLASADASAMRTALSLGGAAVLNVGTSAGTVAAGDDSRITGAVQSSTLTTRGDLLRRGASAPERFALGAAGTRLRSDGTDPLWSEPDLVCTFAELSTTYAPSAVLCGVIAYATDKLATYVCRRTGVSTYAWRVIAYDRALPGGATAQAWWKLEEAAGSTTFANSGAGGTATLTATTSGSGAAVYAGTGCGPWGQPCVSLSQSASGAAYLESASGVIEPAYPITVSMWIRAQGTSIGAETNSRYGKKYIAAYTPITNAVGFTVLAVTSTSGPYGAGSAVCVGGVVTFSPTVRGVLGGSWSLLTTTYDGTTHTCYVNGRTPGGTAQSGAIDYGTGSGRTWYFGSSPIASTDRLNGQLSEIRVDGTAWTAAKVLEAYQRGVGTWDGGL